MKSPYCNHPWPIPKSLEKDLANFSVFPELRHFCREFDLVGKYVDMLGFTTFVSSLRGKDEPRTFSSVDECKHFLRACHGRLLDKHLKEDEAFAFTDLTLPLSALGPEELKWFIRAAYICDSYLQGQKKPKVEGNEMSTLQNLLELQEEAVAVRRDTQLIYRFGRAANRVEGWPEDYIWFLFLMRLWDERSVVMSHRHDREQAYSGLLGLHYEKALEPGQSSQFLDCPPECLKSFFSCLWKANPGSMLEAIGWLGDLARENERIERDLADNAWLLENSYDWHGDEGRDISEGLREAEEESHDTSTALPDAIAPPKSISSLRDFARTIAKSVKEVVQEDSAQLLLHSFGSLGGIERKLLLELFGVNEIGVKYMDMASDLAKVGLHVSLGRVSAAPIDKLRGFQKAVGQIDAIGEEWSSRDWWKTGTIRAALNKAKADLIRARIDLPISHVHVEPLAARREIFFFAFFVDHENFWKALVNWVKENHPGLYDYRGPGEEKSIFETNYFEKPTAYHCEHVALMDHVLSRLRSAWRRYCGVLEFDDARAYSYWKWSPNAHEDAYSDFHIKPDRPTVSAKKDSGAVDQAISTEMMLNVKREAEQQGKKPFYVIVSGDAGYADPLEGLRTRENIEYQYWYFKSQRIRRYLRNLPEGRVVWLEGILNLDGKGFPVTRLHIRR